MKPPRNIFSKQHSWSGDHLPSLPQTYSRRVIWKKVAEITLWMASAISPEGSGWFHIHMVPCFFCNGSSSLRSFPALCSLVSWRISCSTPRFLWWDIKRESSQESRRPDNTARGIFWSWKGKSRQICRVVSESSVVLSNSWTRSSKLWIVPTSCLSLKADVCEEEV